MGGISVQGRRLPVEKLRKEARRCLRCQKLEPRHMARDCELIADVCGTCAGLHSTHECTEPRRQCVNCGTTNHASWDRKCPAFIEATRKVQKANSLEQYRFFPMTDDPSTWEHLDAPQLTDNHRAYASEVRLDPPSWFDDHDAPRRERDAPPHDRYMHRRRSRSPVRTRSRSPARGANRIPVNTEHSDCNRSANSRLCTWSLQSTSGQRQSTITPTGELRLIPSRPRTPSVSGSSLRK